MMKYKNVNLTILLKKIHQKISHKIKWNQFKKQDCHVDVRFVVKVPLITNSYIKINHLDFSGLNRKTMKYLIEMYTSHRFDLLGSGWVENSYGSNSLGVEGYRFKQNLKIKQFDPKGNWLKQVVLPSHIKKSQFIWKEISKNYQPIDWQKDYKSGFRWDAQEWSKALGLYHLGADVKVPWELSRFQHVVQLAIFAVYLPKYRSKLILEFKNQVLDFMATNPIRMGVNWVCTMDIGVRAANLLVAYDIFTQIDKEQILDQKFKKYFSNFIYEHGKHIVKNLEWGITFANNHYLSDIAGLLFIAAYLKQTPEINRWLAFSIQEMITEVKRQFYDDGGNFESSTSYHRLSGELVAYSTAFIVGLPQKRLNSLRKYNPKLWKNIPNLKPFKKQEYNLNDENFFPNWYWERLYKAGLFTQHLTKPTGEIPQIGDNDSGRFFKFSPNGSFITNQVAEKKYLNLKGYNKAIKNHSSLSIKKMFWDENIINHGTFLSALSGLFLEKEFKDFSKKYPLERSIILSFSQSKGYVIPVKTGIQFFQDGLSLDSRLRGNDSSPITDALQEDKKQYPFSHQTTIKPEKKSKIPLNQHISLIPYPDSGIYIFKSDRLHLTISACPNGQNGIGGHAHNDKLSFELNLDGKDLIRDPGTYLYTPLPDQRNHFRSTKAHSTITINDEEQNNFPEGVGGLFNLKNETRISLLNYEKNKITLAVTYRKNKIRRTIEILPDKIIVTDQANKKFTVHLNQKELCSNGYGKLHFQVP